MFRSDMWPTLPILIKTVGASEVCFKLDKTSVSHSLNSVNRQIFQLTTSSIMPRTINEQILYIIGTFFAVKENSSESNLQLFGCHQSRSATVSWTDTWRWCNYRITKLISIRDQKNIPSNQREKKIEGKVPLQSGQQWMKGGQEPCLSKHCPNVSRQRNMTTHERLDKKNCSMNKKILSSIARAP